MSALPQTLELRCACGSLHLCECGCGGELNPNIRRVHELTAAGAGTAQVAAAIGVSTAWVKAIKNGRGVPRFIKGHAARVNRLLGVAECANCGEPFRKMGPNHLYCTSPSARPRDAIRAQCGQLALKAKWAAWHAYDAAVAERAAIRKQAVEARRRLRSLLTRETDPEWWVAQREEIRREAFPELAALIEEQERDERSMYWASNKWVLSLDAPVGDGDAKLLDFVDSSGRLTFGQRHVPDFSAVVCAVVDRRREIDSYADAVTEGTPE